MTINEIINEIRKELIVSDNDVFVYCWGIMFPEETINEKDIDNDLKEELLDEMTDELEIEIHIDKAIEIYNLLLKEELSIEDVEVEEGDELYSFEEE